MAARGYLSCHVLGPADGEAREEDSDACRLLRGTGVGRRAHTVATRRGREGCAVLAGRALAEGWVLRGCAARGAGRACWSPKGFGKRRKEKQTETNLRQIPRPVATTAPKPWIAAVKA